MIIGIGVDVVDIERFQHQIESSPRLAERLFSEHERELPLRSLAARYAAKEALIKALGGSDGVQWRDIEVPRLGERQAPSYVVTGVTAGTLAARGVAHTHLSLSHDAGLAIAYVVLEGDPPPTDSESVSPGGATRRVGAEIDLTSGSEPERSGGDAHETDHDHTTEKRDAR